MAQARHGVHAPWASTLANYQDLGTDGPDQLLASRSLGVRDVSRCSQRIRKRLTQPSSVFANPNMQVWLPLIDRICTGTSENGQ